MTDKRPDRAGIRSIEVGMPLLAAFVGAPEAMTLKALAQAAGMSSSKAHKYLVSYIRAGLITQDMRNGSYRLGPMALELGFAALRHLNVVDIAESAMTELRDTLNFTVSLTVWANQGPTLVRRVETRQLQFINMRLGTVLPLLTSANGRVFLAFLDRAHTQPHIEAALSDTEGAAERFGLRTMQDVEELVAKIRVEGVAEINGYMSGLTAMSTPVFDAANTVAAALTITGRHDAGVQRAKSRLLAVAADLSRQLGASHIVQRVVSLPAGHLQASG